MITQWRATDDGFIGLDYAQLWTVAEVLEIEITSELFAKIQRLEAQVLRDQDKQKEKLKNTQAQQARSPGSGKNQAAQPRRAGQKRGRPRT